MNFTALRRTLLPLLAALLATSAGTAQTGTDPDKTLSPYFFVLGDPRVDRLPLKETGVDIRVSGVIADVHVRQLYTNDGTRPVSATYVFPASTRAAVYGMRMRIGDLVIVAKIKEREQARQEFEAAKKAGKSASLLEQVRPNVFTMGLANLMPGEEVEIELRYTELLVPTAGQYQVVYPTVVGPRYASAFERKKDNTFLETPYTQQGEPTGSHFHLRATIAAGGPIYDVNSTSHQIESQWHGRNAATLTINDADPHQGNRDFLLNYRLSGEQISAGLMLYRGADENFFLYMAQPPRRVAVEDIPPREYVFVVDVSGSMEGFPLDVSKRLLQDLIGGLRDTDFFNVILFAGDSTALSETPLSANPENIDRALQLIEEQRGGGGTELLPAMKQAIDMSQSDGVSRSIVLVTDGYVSIEEGVFRYIRQNLVRANLFAFGIGSSVNRYLIEGAAKAGLGEPFIIEDESKAAETAARFREYIQSPLLTDISIRADGFDMYDIQPGGVPDLFADRPIVMFGKWRGTPAGTIELSGRSGRGDFTASVNVADVQPDETNTALIYLWARARIAELSDHAYGEVSDVSKKEVTDLGLKYNLLTKYTSFIAVREKIVNPNDPAEDVNQPLPLPVGVSNLAVGSEPGLLWLLAGLSGLLLLVLVKRCIRAGAAASRPAA